MRGSKPTVLLVLDGYGLNDNPKGNAIAMAKTPVMDKLMAECPFVAGQASGMNELAAAIRSVAQATTELNEVNAQSKISAEALSGQALGQKEMLQEIKESAPVEDGNGKIFEEMLTILKSLNDNMTEIRSSLNHSADIQEKSMRLSQGKTQFMQD